MLNTPEEAYSLLQSLGAPKRLLVHAQLVAGAAEGVLAALRPLGVPVREDIVRLSAVLHDAGKIAHPGELGAPGSAHEAAGEALLLAAGVAPAVARCCLAHARYETMAVSFEELLVALADKLWKGRREAGLELRVIDGAAALLGKGRWDVFAELDGCFERIAAEGDERLARSRVP